MFVNILSRMAKQPFHGHKPFLANSYIKTNLAFLQGPHDNHVRDLPEFLIQSYDLADVLRVRRVAEGEQGRLVRLGVPQVDQHETVRIRNIIVWKKEHQISF